MTGGTATVRRVVTGRADNGDITIISDEPASAIVELPEAPGSALVDLWRDDTLPPDMSTSEDPTQGEFELMPAGTLFRVIDLVRSDADPLWHETESIDFIYVATGAATFVSAAGETELIAGDSIIVRGGRHAWVNRHDTPCRLVDVSMGVATPAEITLPWQA